MGEKGEKEKQDANTQRYVTLGAITIFVCGLYFITRSKHSAEDTSLLLMYESKIAELEKLMADKDLVLNETYTVLKKTYHANRLQEEAVKGLQIALRGKTSELTDTKFKFVGTNKSAAALIAQLDGLKEVYQANLEEKEIVQTSVMKCRQEAAASLQEKEQKLWQHQQALERAREDVEELQKAVRQREGIIRERELHMQEQVAAHKGRASALTDKLEERERSIAWLAEKKRQDNENHAINVANAKTERSCHNDIMILREELNKALQRNHEQNVQQVTYTKSKQPKGLRRFFY